MRRRILSLCGAALLAPIAQAQVPIENRGVGPATPASPAVQQSRAATSLPGAPLDPPGKLPVEVLRPKLLDIKPVDRITKFDPHAVEVRRDGQRWQLWSGKTMLKDFGDYRDRAFEARRLVAELKLTERGAIGSPEPVMEYWLADGQAPPLPSLARSVISFDPDSLKVREQDGYFYLGDTRKVLFNFGPYAQDAQHALAIVRKYGFNELSFVGAPNPSMTILLSNPNHMAIADNTMQSPKLIAQMSSRHPLDIPGVGRVGESRFFDPLRLDINKAGDGWHLMAGTVDLGLLDRSEYRARTAMQIAQRFPFTEQVRVGNGDFTFYLSKHTAPRGVPLGIRSAAFQPKLLQVQQAGNQWNVTDGRVTLATLSSAAEANQVLAVIKHFGFNCSCEAGQGLKFLALDR